MWCRPEPSSVSPMYMPGRLRTASRPLSTLIESAPYSAAPSAEVSSIGSSAIEGVQDGQAGGVHQDSHGPTLEVVEQRLVRAGEKGLERERLDFVEERRAPERVQVRGDFIQE